MLADEYILIVPSPYQPQSGLKCVTKKQMSNQMFRNCINDGSRPAVHVLQQECTNRLKVLCSKGKVLSV
jgi:hypothetical protein